MSRARTAAAGPAPGVTVGLQGVNLLPASVYAAQDARRLRRRLGAGLVVLVVLLGGGFGVLLGSEGQARRERDLAHAETARLQHERERYAEAGEVRAAIAQAVDARAVGMGTEIRWVDLIRRIEAVAPAGTTMTSFSAQGVAPADGSSFTAPDLLASPGVATIAFRVESPTLPDTAAWLEALEAVPGLMDAWFSDVTLTEGVPEEGVPEVYAVSSTVQVNVLALSGAHLDSTSTEGTS